MKHCETCRCEERELREDYFRPSEMSAVEEYARTFQIAYDRVAKMFNAMEFVSLRHDPWDARLDELRAWAAEQNMAPSPPETWRPYRPELAAPFYGKEYRP